MDPVRISPRVSAEVHDHQGPRPGPQVLLLPHAVLGSKEEEGGPVEEEEQELPAHHAESEQAEPSALLLYLTQSQGILRGREREEGAGATGAVRPQVDLLEEPHAVM